MILKAPWVLILGVTNKVQQANLQIQKLQIMRIKCICMNHLCKWREDDSRRFSHSICPSKKYSGLVSFRIDWFDLLAVQGTLKSLLQHHSSKASVLRCSDFFMVQLSHPYMTTGKTIPWTRWTFVGKVMSLLSNMLSRLIIAFLPRSKCLLISWLQSPSAVILEPPKIVCPCFHCFPIYLSWSDVTKCHDLSFLNA